MKLLIVTQKVDRNDPILGFFHRWIEEFAKHFGKVTVIGQYVGEHVLPDKVEVVSLGKEKGRWRWLQIIIFWFQIWKKQKEYDCVFVHMTPIWAVLGGRFWRKYKKRVSLWYEARGAGKIFIKALQFSDVILSASEHTIPLDMRKRLIDEGNNFIVIGHCIDTEAFSFHAGKRDEKLLTTVGRITRSKRLDVILQCIKDLPSDYALKIIGVPITKEDQTTLRSLQDFLDHNQLRDRVTLSSMSQMELVPFLQNAGMFLHASETSLDKAVLEAMACGCPVVSASKAIHPILTKELQASNENMAQKVQEWFSLPEARCHKICINLREEVVRKHSISHFIDRLVKFL